VLNFLAAILLSMALLAATSLLHWESLNRLCLIAQRHSHLPRWSLMIVIVALVVTHLLEIGLYAAGYGLASMLGLGRLTAGTEATGLLSHFYFSAQTYSTLGYGDIVPSGEMRLIASIEPLNGLILLAWSGAFLFFLMQKISNYRP
jgi:hypothetical protein